MGVIVRNVQKHASQVISKEEPIMKKLVALCAAMVLAVAMLAGCSSADPENPYGQEPAPMNETSTETSAVVVEVL